MVFGMKLFGTSSSSSPGKESVDSGAPRKTDRVEVPSPAGANAPVLAEEPLEQINIPGFPGGHISSMQAAEPLAGENAMGTLPRDSTATSYSGFQPATARTSAATMMPSVSMVLEGAAEKAAHARTEPVSTEVPLEAHGVPLNAIPDFVLNEHPELKLANYDLSRGNICSNAILAIAPRRVADKGRHVGPICVVGWLCEIFVNDLTGRRPDHEESVQGHHRGL